jgi:hypothetical protein
MGKRRSAVSAETEREVCDGQRLSFSVTSARALSGLSWPDILCTGRLLFTVPSGPRTKYEMQLILITTVQPNYLSLLRGDHLHGTQTALLDGSQARMGKSR